MKKLIAILACGLLLTACGQAKEEAAPADAAQEQSAQATTGAKDAISIYNAVETKADGKLTVLDPEYVLNYFGVDTNELESSVFAQSETPESSAETVIIMEAADNSKFDTYKESFESFKTQKAQELTNYNLPDEAKLVEDSKVVEKGNAMYLVISKNADEIAKTIDENL